MNKIVSICFLCILSYSCKKEYETIPTINVNLLSTPTTSSINSMTFPKAATGFAVCTSGELLKTTDYGNTWTVDTVFTGYTLSKIIFPDSITGFILAENFSTGKLLKTSNGGNSWTDITTTFNLDPVDISFPTPLVGYALSSTYEWKTTDGGQIWSHMNFPSSSFSPSLISFASRDTGYVRDFDSELYRTTDGGTNWTQVFSEVGQAREINFKSKVTGYACDGGGSIYKTTDALNWTTVYDSNTETEFQLQAIDMRNGIGMSVGDLSIVISNNDGSSWEFRRTQEGITPQVTFTDIFIHADQSGIACATNGSFYKITLGDF